jgi:hypothetical protein
MVRLDLRPRSVPLPVSPSLDRSFLLMVRYSTALLLLIGLLCCASPGYAQQGAQTVSADLDQLVRSAGTILRGQVISVNVEPHPQFPNLQTVVVTISVARVLKGEAASTFTFRQFIWDRGVTSDAAGYRKSGELLLLLNPVSPYGLTSPVGLEQGRFRVVRDAKGKGFAVNGRANFGLFQQVVNKASSRGISFSRQAEVMMAKPSGQASLDALEEAIITLAGASK